MNVNEDRLSADIKAGRIDKLYLIYGDEPALAEMYTQRIIKKTLGDEAMDFNFVKADSAVDPDTLAEYVDSFPVFADRKVVIIQDFMPEKFEPNLMKRYTAIINDIPETTVLIFFYIDIYINEKRDKSKQERFDKLKRFFSNIEKNGTVCVLQALSVERLAALAVKKAAKSGVVLSQENALFIVERTGGKMKSASDETAKLITYVGRGGTIEREHIELLTPKDPQADIFDLAGAITSGNRAKAFEIIDELYRKQIKTELILSALAGNFADMYKAKLAKNNGVGADAAAAKFGYFRGKIFVFRKLYTAAARLDVRYLRKTVDILSEADIKTKSLKEDSRTIVEETAARLLAFRKY